MATRSAAVVRQLPAPIDFHQLDGVVGAPGQDLARLRGFVAREVVADVADDGALCREEEHAHDAADGCADHDCQAEDWPGEDVPARVQGRGDADDGTDQRTDEGPAVEDRDQQVDDEEREDGEEQKDGGDDDAEEAKKAHGDSGGLGG